jgi:hypothetical protein
MFVEIRETKKQEKRKLQGDEFKNFYSRPNEVYYLSDGDFLENIVIINFPINVIEPTVSSQCSSIQPLGTILSQVPSLHSFMQLFL